MKNVQTANLNKQRNSSIDLFRYICAVMVVAIHTSPFYDINHDIGYIFTSVVPRIAVPFFFAVSGYFYIQKLENGQRAFRKFICHILLVYFLWSIVYYIIDFAQWGHSNIKNYIFSCVYQFIVTGSHYHFWFFPALIYSACIVTLLYKINLKKMIIPVSILLYFIGCLGCSYYNIGINIPIMGSLFQSAYFELFRRIFLMGFPFFTSGYLAQKLKDRFGRMMLYQQLRLLLVIVAAWVLEIFFVIKLNFANNIVLTFALYPMVLVTLMILLVHPCNEYKALAEESRVAANFTFYAHPLFLVLLDKLMVMLTGSSMTQTVSFILTVLFTLITALVIRRLDNKYLNILVN